MTNPTELHGGAEQAHLKIMELSGVQVTATVPAH